MRRIKPEISEAARDGRTRRLLTTYSRRMFGAMLCWTALQTAATSLDTRAQAETRSVTASLAAPASLLNAAH